MIDLNPPPWVVKEFEETERLSFERNITFGTAIGIVIGILVCVLVWSLQ